MNQTNPETQTPATPQNPGEAAPTTPVDAQPEAQPGAATTPEQQPTQSATAVEPQVGGSTARPTSSQPSGGSKLPMLLGILVAVILLGVGAWWYMDQQAVQLDETELTEFEPAPPVEFEMTEETPLPDLDESDPATTPGDTTDADEEATEVRTIAVEAGSYYFTPATIRVQQGETVRLELTSTDMVHNLVVEGLGISIPMTNAGDTNFVEFTADQVGTFEYFCGVEGHRESGQVGQLIVE